METVSRQDKVTRYRRYILVALFLSAGLSLVFWIYRYTISTPISLPSISRPIPDSPAINLPSRFSHWSIYVQSGDFVWSQKFDQDPNPQISQLEKVTSTPSSLLRDTLPSGVDIKEVLATSSAFYLISIPNRQIFLSFNFPPSESPLLPGLVETIYWTVVRL